MNDYFFFVDNIEPLPESCKQSELYALAAEAIGWHPIGQGAYLHLGDLDDETAVIEVVGLPDIAQMGLNVLLLI